MYMSIKYIATIITIYVTVDVCRKRVIVNLLSVLFFSPILNLCYTTAIVPPYKTHVAIMIGE